MAFTDSLEKHGNGYKNTVYGIWMDARKNLKMTTKNYIKIDNILWNWFFFSFQRKFNLLCSTAIAKNSSQA